MSTLSANSTTAQIEAAYDDNASYAEDNSPAKCRLFITACRLLLRRYVPERQVGENRTGLIPRIVALKEQLDEARRWLADNQHLDPAAVRARPRSFGFDQEDWRNT